jgi:hypothetical protein
VGVTPVATRLAWVDGKLIPSCGACSLEAQVPPEDVLDLLWWMAASVAATISLDCHSCQLGEDGPIIDIPTDRTKAELLEGVINYLDMVLIAARRSQYAGVATKVAELIGIIAREHDELVCLERRKGRPRRVH